ncbi:hypothetical protein FHL15_004792 [Xylaria flabelliformis]|uniref:Nuclear membrane fusion protein Kar5 n=1 Tax=Xylaria flabelliformis TaxID=2512241 RepID=A0A553I298_9PEZI|nr:hypothetical protein FHL15_004792 [Xylaria flabelliformis]
MGKHGSTLACIRALLISLLVLTNATSALLWRGRTTTASVGEQSPILESGNSPSQLLRISARQPSLYEIALHELQELESEPLCHQTAARLLVNNCHLLEGKDEATVLTDSGRKIRDFIDAYAASLAICDLERGRFTIPAECFKFQESTLSQLPIQDAAVLHVTSAEINSCLSGLGASGSAWNTWVSYKHKALRYCEAARVENDKAQNIILFQRLTKIMGSLADEVDVKTEQRMSNLDLRTQAVEDKIESLSPLLKKLQHNLEHADQMLSRDLLQGLKVRMSTCISMRTQLIVRPQKSHYQIISGVKSAEHLEKMLQAILQDALNYHAEAAATHDQSLQLMSRQASLETNIMVSNMAAAVAAAAALQNDIEATRIRSSDLESRQDNLEQGMQRLIDISDKLASKYDTHTDILQQAQNITNEILDTLENTATAVSVGFLGQDFMKSLWSYVGCPFLFLVTGSYGLSSSTLRNLSLIALDLKS